MYTLLLSPGASSHKVLGIPVLFPLDLNRLETSASSLSGSKTSKMIAFTILGFAVLAFIFNQLFRNYQHKQRAKQLHCEVPKQADNFLFGLRSMQSTQPAIKENRLCSFQLEQFESILKAKTYAFTLLGTPIVCTIEPENVKALLATQFNDFCLGDRHNQFHSFMGDGIFTLDGKGWSIARSFLRPQFSKDQVGKEKKRKESSFWLVHADCDIGCGY